MWFDWRRYNAAPWDHDRTHLPAATARIGATEPMTHANLLETIRRIRIQLALRFPSANPLTVGATEPMLVGPSETMANMASVPVSVGASETIANMPSKNKYVSVDASETTVPAFFVYRVPSEELGRILANRYHEPGDPSGRRNRKTHKDTSEALEPATCDASLKEVVIHKSNVSHRDSANHTLQSSTLAHGVTEPMMPCGATELSVSGATESNTWAPMKDGSLIGSRQTPFP